MLELWDHAYRYFLGYVLDFLCYVVLCSQKPCGPVPFAGYLESYQIYKGSIVSEF
jgi:cytosine/uracil/thiamine/allantoin permease